MSFPFPGRGAHAAPHRRGARQLHFAKRKRPRIVPTACLESIQARILAALATGPKSLGELRIESIQARILAALATGPKSLGELRTYYLGGLKASIRDEAIADLLKAGKVRLTSIPHLHSWPHQAIPGVALAEGVRGG